jgi:hypothetical protein
MQHKLVFIETPDVVETTLALDNYRKACDCGRGAVFFSVARLACFNFFPLWKCPFSLVAISYQTKGILELLQLTRYACVSAYILGEISFLADASLF